MSKWLLWSNERRAFWRRGGGVTRDVAEASRFTFDMAATVCAAAAQADEPLINIDGHEMPWHVPIAAPEEEADG